MLGVNSSITAEQIWEGYYQSRIKFFTEHPRDSEENKEKSEGMFMTILGTLTDIAERKRYDEHLKQFGLDQIFSLIMILRKEILTK